MNRKRVLGKLSRVDFVARIELQVLLNLRDNRLQHLFSLHNRHTRLLEVSGTRNHLVLCLIDALYYFHVLNVQTVSFCHHLFDAADSFHDLHRL